VCYLRPQYTTLDFSGDETYGELCSGEQLQHIDILYCMMGRCGSTGRGSGTGAVEQGQWHRGGGTGVEPPISEIKIYQDV
jgi:hypothetical protein